MIAAGIGWFPRLFILPHVIIGICLVLYPFLMLATNVFGTDIPAVIHDKYTRNDSEDGRINTLVLRYECNGKECFDKENVGYEKYESYKVGDQVVVHCIPALKQLNKQFRKPDGQFDPPDWGTVAFFAFFALFWNGICGVFVMVLYVVPVINWWLLRYGAVSEGLVLAKERSTDSDGDARYTVDYAFIPGKRAEHIESATSREKESKIRSSTSVPREVFDSLQEGDAISILHMRKWPKVNLAFECSDLELAS